MLLLIRPIFVYLVTLTEMVMATLKVRLTALITRRCLGRMCLGPSYLTYCCRWTEATTPLITATRTFVPVYLTSLMNQRLKCMNVALVLLRILR